MIEGVSGGGVGACNSGGKNPGVLLCGINNL